MSQLNTALWRSSSQPVPYLDAIQFMEERVAAISAGTAEQMLWALEHPSLYTKGTSAKDGDLLVADRFPVFEAGRGGEFTYHGPGQRVLYVMLDLKKWQKDVRAYVAALEDVVIRTLRHFDVVGERRAGRVGIWVQVGATEKKIAAIGVRLRKWVSFHGLAINVAPDLSHFSGIVPCGIQEYGVTSLADLGISTSLAEVDKVLQKEIINVFNLDLGASYE
ncbi:MAG: lipoyl(octanoyl) transferase LipB [Alphaproteobacteria bacterium]